MKRLLPLFFLIFFLASCDFLPGTDPNPNTPDIPENPADLALGTGTYELNDSLVYSAKFDTSANIISEVAADGRKLTQIVWDNSQVIDTDIFGLPTEDYFSLILNFLLDNEADPAVGTYTAGTIELGLNINVGLQAISGTLEIQELLLEDNGYMIGSFDGIVVETPIFNGTDTVKINLTNCKFHLPIYY